MLSSIPIAPLLHAKHWCHDDASMQPNPYAGYLVDTTPYTAQEPLVFPEEDQLFSFDVPLSPYSSSSEHTTYDSASDDLYDEGTEYEMTPNGYMVPVNSNRRLTEQFYSSQHEYGLAPYMEYASAAPTLSSLSCDNINSHYLQQTPDVNTSKVLKRRSLESNKEPLKPYTRFANKSADQIAGQKVFSVNGSTAGIKSDRRSKSKHAAQYPSKISQIKLQQQQLENRERFDLYVNLAKEENLITTSTMGQLRKMLMEEYDVQEDQLHSLPDDHPVYYISCPRKELHKYFANPSWKTAQSVIYAFERYMKRLFKEEKRNMTKTYKAIYSKYWFEPSPNSQS